MKPADAIKLLNQTRQALAGLDDQDPGIQAALTIGWEDTHLRPQDYRGADPREWSPRRGGSVTASDVLGILGSMGMELEQSDDHHERDAVQVALRVIYRAMETIKKGLRLLPDWKLLRDLSIADFTRQVGRKPKLPLKS